MKLDTILNAAPGSRFLVSGDPKKMADLLERIGELLPETLVQRARLNAAPILSLQIIPEMKPDAFSSLETLCARLVTGAGRRSHFEGLLLLNISYMALVPRQELRLKALGEVLAMKEGLASRCVTLLYRPETDEQLIFCANHLDFDARLNIGTMEFEEGAQALDAQLAQAGLRCDTPQALDAQLAQAGLRCDTPQTLDALQEAMAKAAKRQRFNLLKCLRAISDAQGVITADALRRMSDDPYSYLNRAMREEKQGNSAEQSRRIGFA